MHTRALSTSGVCDCFSVEARRPWAAPILIAAVIALLLPPKNWAQHSAVDSHAPRTRLAKMERRILTVLPRIEAATVCIEGGPGSGSGVIVSEDGLVLTAAHVIHGATDLTVVYPDGRRFAAKALGTYGPADAGMVQIVDGAPHPFADIASGDIAVGDTVLALGHPSGFDLDRGVPLRLGHVAAANDAFISTDCALIGGDSGGPSFNLDGEVIGIHSNISPGIAENRDGVITAYRQHWEEMKSGVHHAITYDQALSGGVPDPFVLGLKLTSDTYGEGLTLEEVIENTPASRSGFHPGDRVLLVDGDSPVSASRFLQTIQAGGYGVQIDLTIARAGEELKLPVRLVKQSRLEAARRKWAAGEELPLTPEEEQLDRSRQEQSNNTQPSPLPQSAVAGESPDAAPKPLSRLQELSQNAQANKGRLKLTREDLRNLRRQLTQRTELLTPDGQRVRDDWTGAMAAAFRDSQASLSQSVFPVYTSKRWTSLATAIDADGLLVTKASEIAGENEQRDFEIELSPEERVAGDIVAIDKELDLALVRIPRRDLKRIELVAVGDELATKGTLCGAIGAGDRLAGHGVVSVAARPLNGKTGVYLGVSASPHERGLLVDNVEPSSPAHLCGLKPGDLLATVEGEPLHTSEELKDQISKRQPEDIVRLDIERQGSLLSVIATLAENSNVAPMPGAHEQPTDGMSTSMSRRRWGFASGLQHDCAIRPKDCGGPLVDLEGRVLGINIARAGRIKSYAIPSAAVAKFIASHTSSATPK